MSFGLRCLKELEQPLLTRLRLKSTFCLPSPPSICVVAVSHLQSTEAVSHVLKHDHRVWQITGPQGSHHDWCAPLSLSCLKKKKKRKEKGKKEIWWSWCVQVLSWWMTYQLKKWIMFAVGTPVRSLTLHLETLCATVCVPTPTGGMILLVKMEERGVCVHWLSLKVDFRLTFITFKGPLLEIQTHNFNICN